MNRLHPFALFLFGCSLQPPYENCDSTVSSSSSNTAAVPVAATSVSKLSQKPLIAELFCGAVGSFCSDAIANYI